MTENLNQGRPAEETKVDVLLVGGGFSGLCMAIKRREAGMNSFLLVEKSEDIVGTSYDNRHPDCACDIPSHLYSFSFAPMAGLSRMFKWNHGVDLNGKNVAVVGAGASAIQFVPHIAPRAA